MFELNINQTSESTAFDTVDTWDLLIIGAGPAGLNAALYAKRKGMEVGLIAKETGGQLHNTKDVDNYLGFSMIEGKGLSDKFKQHVDTLDIPYKHDVDVTKLVPTYPGYTLTLSNGQTLNTKTVLMATGGKPRHLDIPGENTFANKGVSYCTTCDAPFFKDKHVIVAGGGNAAAEAVLDLTVYARHVTVIHRSQWRADQVLLDKIHVKPNVTIHLETQLLSIEGDRVMERVHVLDKKPNTKRTIDAEGLFIEIGNVPNSHLIASIVDTNQNQEVLVNSDQSTSLPGLYAAGDITANPHKQIIIATAEGAKAALAANQYINQSYKENSYGKSTESRSYPTNRNYS